MDENNQGTGIGDLYSVIRIGIDSAPAVAAISRLQELLDALDRPVAGETVSTMRSELLTITELIVELKKQMNIVNQEARKVGKKQIFRSADVESGLEFYHAQQELNRELAESIILQSGLTKAYSASISRAAVSPGASSKDIKEDKHQRELEKIDEKRRDAEKQEAKNFANLAIERSKDSACKRRNVGVVIEGADGSIIGEGVNTSPTCDGVTCTRELAKAKAGEGYKGTCSAIHGEVNAIEAAKKAGKDLAGAKMHMTDYPCQGCAEAIVAAGIKEFEYVRGEEFPPSQKVLDAAGIKAVKSTSHSPELLAAIDKFHVDVKEQKYLAQRAADEFDHNQWAKIEHKLFELRKELENYNPKSKSTPKRMSSILSDLDNLGLALPEFDKLQTKGGPRELYDMTQSLIKMATHMKDFRPDTPRGELGIVASMVDDTAKKLISVFDIETTGVINDKTRLIDDHRVTEIAIKQFNRAGELVNEYIQQINPERSIPAEVQKLTGITDDLVKNAPKFGEVIDTVNQMLEGTLLVGQNIEDFDIPFLKQMMELHGKQASFTDNKTIDTLKVARRIKFPGGHALKNLVEKLGIGIPTDQLHRGGVDVDATWEVFKAIIGKHYASLVRATNYVGTPAQMDAADQRAKIEETIKQEVGTGPKFTTDADSDLETEVAKWKATVISTSASVTAEISKDRQKLLDLADRVDKARETLQRHRIRGALDMANWESFITEPTGKELTSMDNSELVDSYKSVYGLWRQQQAEIINSDVLKTEEKKVKIAENNRRFIASQNNIFNTLNIDERAVPDYVKQDLGNFRIESFIKEQKAAANEFTALNSRFQEELAKARITDQDYGGMNMDQLGNKYTELLVEYKKAQVEVIRATKTINEIEDAYGHGADMPEDVIAKLTKLKERAAAYTSEANIIGERLGIINKMGRKYAPTEDRLPFDKNAILSALNKTVLSEAQEQRSAQEQHEWDNAALRIKEILSRMGSIGIYAEDRTPYFKKLFAKVWRGTSSDFQTQIQRQDGLSLAPAEADVVANMIGRLEKYATEIRQLRVSGQEIPGTAERIATAQQIVSEGEAELAELRQVLTFLRPLMTERDSRTFEGIAQVAAANREVINATIEKLREATAPSKTNYRNMFGGVASKEQMFKMYKQKALIGDEGYDSPDVYDAHIKALDELPEQVKQIFIALHRSISDEHTSNAPAKSDAAIKRLIGDAYTAARDEYHRILETLSAEGIEAGATRRTTTYDKERFGRAATKEEEIQHIPKPIPQAEAGKGTKAAESYFAAFDDRISDLHALNKYLEELDNQRDALKRELAAIGERGRRSKTGVLPPDLKELKDAASSKLAFLEQARTFALDQANEMKLELATSTRGQLVDPSKVSEAKAQLAEFESIRQAAEKRSLELIQAKGTRRLTNTEAAEYATLRKERSNLSDAIKILNTGINQAEQQDTTVEKAREDQMRKGEREEIAGQRLREVEVRWKELGDQIRTANEDLDKLLSSGKDVSKYTDEEVKEINKLNERIASLGRTKKLVGGRVKELSGYDPEKDGGIRTPLTKITGKWDKMMKIFSNRVGRVVTGILVSRVIYGAVGAMRQLVASTVDFNNKIQEARASFSILIGDVEKANQFMGTMLDYAAATPMSYEQVFDAARRLYAAGGSMGKVMPDGSRVGAMDWSNIKDTIGLAMDASVVRGTGPEGAMGVVQAFSRIMTRAKLGNRELMQLTRHGIPVYKILQEKFGLTRAQLQDVGRLNIPVEKAMAGILEGIRDLYGGATELAAQTTGGMTKTIKENLRMGLDIVGAPILKMYRGWLTKIRNKLRGERLVDEDTGLVEYVGGLIDIGRRTGVGGMFENLVPKDLQFSIRSILWSFTMLFHVMREGASSVIPLLSSALKTTANVLGLVAPVLMFVVNILKGSLQTFMQATQSLQTYASAMAGLLVAVLVVKSLKTLLLVLSLFGRLTGVTAVLGGIVRMLTAMLGVTSVLGLKIAIFVGILAGLMSLGRAMPGFAATLMDGFQKVANIISSVYPVSIDEFLKPLTDDTTKKATTEFSDNFANMVDDVDFLMDEMEKMFTASFDEVFGVTDDSASMIDKLLEGTLGSGFNIDEALKAIEESLKFEWPDMPNIGEAFTRVKEAIKDTFGQETLDTVTRWAKNVATTVAAIGVGVLLVKGIVGAFTGLPATLGGKLLSIGGSIASMLIGGIAVGWVMAKNWDFIEPILQSVFGEKATAQIKRFTEASERIVNTFVNWFKERFGEITIDDVVEALLLAMGSFASWWDTDGYNVLNFAVDLFNALKEVMGWVIDKVMDMIIWFSGLDEGAQKVVATLGLIALVIGKAGLTGTVIHAIGLMASALGPYGALAIAIAGIIALVLNLNSELDKLADEMADFEKAGGGGGGGARGGTIPAGYYVDPDGNMVPIPLEPNSRTAPTIVPVVPERDRIIRTDYTAPDGSRFQQHVELARGGVVKRPTLGMIAEAGVPEAVTPLTKQALRPFAQAIVAEMGGFGGVTHTGPLLTVNGSLIANRQSLRELERMLYDVRQDEKLRRGSNARS